MQTVATRAPNSVDRSAGEQTIGVVIGVSRASKVKIDNENSELRDRFGSGLYVVRVFRTSVGLI